MSYRKAKNKKLMSAVTGASILALVVLSVLSGAFAYYAIRPSSAASSPSLQHIIVVMMENKGYSEIVGNKQYASFLNSATFSSESELLTNFWGMYWPSLPNYIAVNLGNNANISSDCLPTVTGCNYGGEGICSASYRQLQGSRGRHSWKG